MIDFFRNNIKEVMEWSDAEYKIFLNRYRKSYDTFRPKAINSKSYMYNEEYLDGVLSLFLVYKHLIEDKKAFLIALILNGIASDKTNLYPSTIQSSFINDFFTYEDVELRSMFHTTTLNNIKFLCNNSDIDVELNYSDTLSIKDLELFNDFRLFFQAITIPEKGLIVIYFMNPKTVKYQLKNKSSGMDFPSFIEKLFSVKFKIKNNNLKELFSYKINSFIELSQRIKQI